MTHSSIFLMTILCLNSDVDLQGTCNSRRHWLILVSHTAVLLGSLGSKVIISIWMRPVAEKKQ